MASPARILSLNLGTQTVGLAEFKVGAGGGLVLTAYELTELLADPAADATRLSQAKIAVGEMKDRLRFGSERVNYAISAQSVFTRFVKLPSVAEQQVEQIISFEAQQNVPFPIDEVVWDYQLVSGGDPSNVEVVLVAIKADLLNEVNDAVEEVGLQTSVVDVAPMALYNAFRYNYSDIGGCSLLIDIGARTTNLIFIETGKIFSRSIPIGGSAITAAIAKDFDEPFGAAEERKKEVGFVSLGGSYAEPSDPDVARVSKMVRNSMTRLHAEISRSISFYRAQQQGSQPNQIYLCGGSASLPYMREFFQEKLQRPIEFFNPLRNVAIAGDLNSEDVGRRAHVLGELVGLALRGTSNCPMELSLRPNSVVAAQKLEKRQPYIVAAGICLLLCLAGWWLYFLKAGGIEEVVLAELSPKVQKLQSLETKQRKVRKDVADLEKRAEPLVQAVRQRGYWVRVLDDLNARLPEDYVWLTSLEIGMLSDDGEFKPLMGEFGSAPRASASASSPRPNTASSRGKAGKAEKAKEASVGLRLLGLYLDNERQAAVVDDFLKNLKESPYFDIDLSRKNVVNPVRQTPTFTEWAYEFEFRLKLKDSPFDFGT